MKKNYLLTVSCLIFCFAMQAQTFQTWRNDSGTEDNSWQNTVNWWNFPDASPIEFGQQEWDNNHIPAQVNSADLDTWRFLYKAGATDAHTFSGNQISFFDFSTQDPQIINQSTGTHTINNNINGDPDAADPLTFVIDNTGGLILGGTINNQGWIDINGATADATTITFSGVISGTGGLTKENANISVVYKTSNTYSGATNVNNGTLTIEGSLENSDVNVGATGTLIITENATLKSLTVTSGGIVSIASGKSLIITDTATGDVTYNQTLGTTDWYLMSPPVSGVTFNDDFVNNNNIPRGQINSSNRAIASYVTSDDSWSYLQGLGTKAAISGAAYSIKRNIAGDVSFTGKINISDVTTAIETTGNGFNLLGNPFTAHMNSKTFLDANSNLDQTQLWVWNQSSESYDVKINSSAFILAPTQGFFVKANSGTDVTFTATNQAATGGTFQKAATTELKLLMTNGVSNRFAKINYANQATKGFDAGYEGEIFGGIPNSLDVFTNLVDDNQGKKYQIQSLPNSDLETMVIPVGIIADAGEITFSAETVNFPSELKVFLEDRENNTFIRLDEANSSYAVTLTEKTDGIGRFYLHTKSSALSTDNVQLENISIYKANASTLRIVGLSQGKANVKLFNILGEQVLNRNFTSNGVYDVNLPQLATGVYIAQLENENGKINKKIVLE